MGKTEQKMSWLEAIKTTLKEAKGPLHYTEITKQILEKGYRTCDHFSSNPEATVNKTINNNSKSFEETSARGVYIWKEYATDYKDNEAIVTENDIIIECFGSHWKKSLIDWENEPDMFGRKQNENDKTKPFNFKGEIGIYVLYDSNRIVYVGQAVKQSIGKRLFQHLSDKTEGKWDNFSWFGFYKASKSGVSESKENIAKMDFSKVANNIETVLIEAINPPLNSKKSIDLSNIEYVQWDEKNQ